MKESRRRIISVIGSGSVSEEDPAYIASIKVGKLLVDNHFRVMTGGLSGIMEGTFKGAHMSDNYSGNDTIAILPGMDRIDANKYSDIIIPTGQGIGRNMIITNADGIIAIGGGSGTLSEIAFSWQKGKIIIAMDLPGWSGDLAGKQLDKRRGDEVIIKAMTPDEAVTLLKSELHKDL